MLCFLLFRAGAAQTTVRIITFCILRLSHPGRNGTQGDGALQPLTLHFAGYRIGLFYVAVDKQVGGGAAAAAIEAGPTVPAVLPGVCLLYTSDAADEL